MAAKFPQISAAAVAKERMGFPFVLILIYLFMEYARPVNPLKIPMLISIILFIKWATLPKKHWDPQVICFALLLLVIGVMGPFAVNSFSVFWGFVGMVVELFCICVPIMHFIDSLRKVRRFINALIVLFVYIAGYAILHSGFGPGGHVADENDVALALNSGIPFAFLSIFIAENKLQKLLYGTACAVMVAGVIASMSRGGFLGLVCVLMYCFAFTPNKARSLGIGLILIIGVAVFAPDKYWGEIASIGVEAANEDPLHGTGALRKLYWAIALEMFYANPIFGVGLENFTWNAELYQTPEMYALLGRTVGNAAHSLYFTILAELGAAGALLFGAIVYFNIRDLSALMRWSKARPEGQTLSGVAEVQPASATDQKLILFYSHAALAGMLGFLSSGIFLSVFVYPHFWLLTALTVVLKSLARGQRSDAKLEFSATATSLSPASQVS